MRVLCIAAVVALTACGGGGGGPAPDPGGGGTPPALAVERVYPSLAFDRPLDLAVAPDGSGRIYVAEQPGRVWRFDPSAPASSLETFLDISAQIDPGGSANLGEQGLLGIAFHPAFASNDRLFLYYMVPGSGRSRLSEFVAGSERVILEIGQRASNHNGGSIAFGPADGYLYVALGDEGGAGDPFANGQNTQTLQGAILRLDVDAGGDYGIPPDNPFAPTDGLDRDEIWAWGLRNPFRISFESLPGGGQRLWAGDVGQDSFEEINIITAGGNYGWNQTEGFDCFEGRSCDPSAFEAPVHVYNHAVGQSVTGGRVYRGSRRTDLHGHYLFADFVSRYFAALDTTSLTIRIETEVPISIAAFGEDATGELILVDYVGGGLWQLTSP